MSGPSTKHPAAHDYGERDKAAIHIVNRLDYTSYVQIEPIAPAEEWTKRMA
jgi:hypothetical protein